MVSVKFVAASAALGMGAMASADVVTVSQSFYNASATAMAFTVTQYAPTASANTTGFMSGSCTLTLSDLNGDGAFISRVGTSSIYTATIDDQAANSLWSSSTFSSFSVGGFMSNSSSPAKFTNVAIPAGCPSRGCSASR